MRCVVFAMALARTQPVPMPLPPVPRGGMLGRLLMDVGVYAPVEHFEGSFYGVRAIVELNMRTRIAMVHLDGVPLGGRLSGTGWLKNCELDSGAVILEPAFAKSLRRRFVTIYSAHLNRKQHTVIVNVKVPVLGIIELVLK